MAWKPGVRGGPTSGSTILLSDCARRYATCDWRCAKAFGKSGPTFAICGVEIGGVRADLGVEIGGVRGEIGGVRADMDASFRMVYAQLGLERRWLVGMWLTTALGFVALLVELHVR